MNAEICRQKADAVVLAMAAIAPEVHSVLIRNSAPWHWEAEVVAPVIRIFVKFASV